VSLKWTGPFTIKTMMQNCLDDAQEWPPHEKSVYLITQNAWKHSPSLESKPLYVGGNTGKSSRLCTRVGDLIADMFGFYDGDTGHHSGGQSLYDWCHNNNIHPFKLHIAWCKRLPWCSRCAEIDVVKLFLNQWKQKDTVGLLNKNRPPKCPDHDQWII